MYYVQTDAVFIFFDFSRRNTINSIMKWRQACPDVPITWIGNKADISAEGTSTDILPPDLPLYILSTKKHPHDFVNALLHTVQQVFKDPNISLIE